MQLLDLQPWHLHRLLFRLISLSIVFNHRGPSNTFEVKDTSLWDGGQVISSYVQTKGDEPALVNDKNGQVT